ncbi:NAD-dependent DNA ligase LigA [Lacrimispora amygdalina]|uniref:NAD-dependent DNA ligase LigA n=1 Tax=Lacrimispora amygdalina TaxID=253257 RepID=UPI001FA90686|nr:NAD-dependent DNA ligase LigA [Lacrimispora amygdalina]
MSMESSSISRSYKEKTSSFVSDYLKGKVAPEALDDYIKNWHEDPNEKRSLPETLGLTEEEYKSYVEDSSSLNKILKGFALKRIDEVVDTLNEAGKAYYNSGNEIMSNFDYDKLYDELLNLELRFNYVREDSPTKNVGYEVESSLTKEAHEYKALSLDKTKDRNSLMAWLKGEFGFLSWKLDGLTIILTYDGGNLTKAVTRGNGEIGENITHNAKYFKGVPKTIDFTGHMVMRGEALITYRQFKKINDMLSETEKYKNPRNLASGSVRQLDAKESARRHIEFKAFELVFAEDEPYLENKNPNAKAKKFRDTYATRFSWLKELGFNTVDYYIVDKDTILDTISQMEELVKKNNFPSDGLVLSFNDVAYGKSLGVTGKFPKHSIAFKWADDLAETTLTEVEWSASRTGLINPVAIFNSIELEGTTVSRASVHNVSIVEELKLGIGDIVTVYKANMIIPQIAENLTKSGTLEIPKVCPVCGAATEIKETLKDGQIVKTLYCSNPDCAAKNIGKFTHFVERDRMNITGLSEATIEKLVDAGFIKEFRDIYHLADHKTAFVEMEGQGEKSYEKLIKAIEKSRVVKLENLIAALGINNVGRDAGKKISKAMNGDIDKFNAKLETGNFLDIEDVGEISNQAINEWYKEQRAKKEIEESEYFNLLKEVEVIKPDVKAGSKDSSVLAGKTFVITGDLELFSSRADLVEKIELLGGKTSGSVSKKTSYLINNDTTSNSSKNKKAKELSVPIISEKDFVEMIKE